MTIYFKQSNNAGCYWIGLGDCHMHSTFSQVYKDVTLSKLDKYMHRGRVYETQANREYLICYPCKL